MRVLVVGCGYVGLPLAQELARRGHEVFGVRRSVAPLERSGQWSGIQPIAADITRREDMEKIPRPFDWVVNTVSSNKGGVDEYRAVYLEGTRNLADWLSSQPPQKYLHVSSTSVYGQTDGAWVTEESATEPQSETSRVLVETEQGLLRRVREKAFPALLLRAAGIYGPERGHLFQQYLLGAARLAGDGSRFLNMIHREDLMGAILTALAAGRPGEIYNVCDDEPVTQRMFFEWLSGELRAPLPPADGGGTTGRKRGLTSKRVSNRKLRLELGCELKYPTFRQGYSAEIARLQAAGQLPAKAGL
jgi:nucleoside-diphosphate-sugar epimerase